MVLVHCNPHYTPGMIRDVYSERFLWGFPEKTAQSKFVTSLRVDKVERVQRRFIRYALRSLGWTDIYDLPPYKHRCALLRLDTLVQRRSIPCILFIFNILGGMISSPNVLSALDLNTPRTNYGVHEPMSATMRELNEVIGLFGFILTRNQFVNRLRLTR
jgi:hypothetical protein